MLSLHVISIYDNGQFTLDLFKCLLIFLFVCFVMQSNGINNTPYAYTYNHKCRNIGRQ